MNFPSDNVNSSASLFTESTADQNINSNINADPSVVILISANECSEKYANLTASMAQHYNSSEFCAAYSDELLCWPPTPIDTVVTLSCFSEFNNVRYDDTQNVSRTCTTSTKWSGANYSVCTEILPDEKIQTVIYVYLAGYILSLISLLVAITIFLYFRELRCLRNKIHMNLICSYIATICSWILLLAFGNGQNVIYILILTVLHYFHVATFFWMFVEGLYLYILVVATLTRENLKLRVYALIGWGLPAIFVTIWAIVKTIFFMFRSSEFHSWFQTHPIDWIYQAPPVLVLLVNLAFLVAIMWVLISKLRSSHTPETMQYYKAAKALLVLIPLLGITYVITIYAHTPDEDSETIFGCVRAVLFSTQGFTVALFYCFVNTEVQNTVRHHFENWKARRSITNNKHRSDSHSKELEWSPRSHASESMRITEWTLVAPDDPDSEAVKMLNK